VAIPDTLAIVPLVTACSETGLLACGNHDVSQTQVECGPWREALFPNATAETSVDRDTETADAACRYRQPLKGQRTEQMYQLADIFASIFEALPEEYEHAIASKLGAA